MRALIEEQKLKNRIRRAVKRRHDPSFHEKELFLIEFLIDGGTAIDVGANKGIYAEMLGRKAKRVLCFEPNPELAANLTLAVDAHVEVRCAAVSSEAGTMTLNIPRADHGGHSPNTATLERVEGPIAESLNVDVVRLDECGAQDVRFIKVDVEGHEEGVINGAKALIERDRPMLMLEFNEPWSDPSQRVFAYFESINYHPMELAGPVLKALPPRPQKLEGRNVLFFPIETEHS